MPVGSCRPCLDNLELLPCPKVPRAPVAGRGVSLSARVACRVSVRAGEGGPRDSPHGGKEAAPNPKKPRGVGGNRPGPNTLEGSCLSRSNRLSEVMAGDVATRRRHRMSHEPSLSKNAVASPRRQPVTSRLLGARPQPGVISGHSHY